METLQWSPISGSESEINYRITTAQFGDGYAQNVADGLNNRVESWPLTFIEQKPAAEQLMVFLDRHGGYKPFLWQPPLGRNTLWTARSPKVKPLGAGLYQITVTLQQAFHP